MFGEILFFLLAISLFTIIFIRMMRKNSILYLVSLILQGLGIMIHLICLIIHVKLNWFFSLFTVCTSILLPISILVCEYKKINLNEIMTIMLAKLLLLKKDSKNAKKILIAYIEKGDESKTAHEMLAQIYEKEGGIRKAIDEYVKIVDLDPQAYDAYYKIAILLKEMGNREDAQNMLKKLVNKKPDHLEASIALSDILCEQERYKEAISLMNEIAKHYPNNFEIYYNMGMIYTMLNDFSSAKMCYEKAAVINSLEYNTNYNIAMIDLILGELEEAEEYFTKCIDDEELSPLAYYQLAKIYMLKGDKETAIKALNIAIELDNTMYTKAMEDGTFIPIKGYITFPNLEDEEEEKEIKTKKRTQKELQTRKHLEKTYGLVDKLNYREMGARYITNRETNSERQIEQ